MNVNEFKIWFAGWMAGKQSSSAEIKALADAVSSLEERLTSIPQIAMPLIDRHLGAQSSNEQLAAAIHGPEN